MTDTADALLERNIVLDLALEVVKRERDQALSENQALRADLDRARAVVEAAQRLRQASWPERQEPRLWRELDVVLDAHQQKPGAGQGPRECAVCGQPPTSPPHCKVHLTPCCPGKCRGMYMTHA